MRLRLRSLDYKWFVAAAFVFGIFMDIMDSTIVNVALPVLGRDFRAGNNTLEWVITGYLLSLAVWIPASGWIGDRFGTKRTFMFALAMFVLGSALCGLSQSIGQLIFFRVLQGVGGGMMTPVGTAMLFRAFPPAERARASVVLMIPTIIAPTLGPILGGLLVTDVSWRWIFYVNLPIGILGFIFAGLFLREHTEAKAGSFDLWGFLFSGSGLALLLYALSQAPTAGWTSGIVLSTGIAGIACFVLLVIAELRVPEPMLDLRLFRDRMFRNANLAFFMSMGGMLGVLFLLPLFLQELLGLSALQSGLTTFPQALGMVAIIPLAGRLYPRVGPRRMMAVGLAEIAATTALFLLVGLDTSLWWVRGIMVLRGFGFGLMMIPAQTATFATIRPPDMGRASAFFNTNRQVAGSIGVAVLATVLVSRTTTHVAAALTTAAPAAKAAVLAHGTLLAYHDAYFAGVVIAAIGVAFAFLIHDEDAAETMGRVVGEQREPVAVH
jgi:EmrB/QacA subfamily drug resistance transporter